MHELWEKNTCQKDIKSTLANEGWDLKHHEFHKIWKANGLRLRNDRGYKVPTSEKPKKRKRRNAAGEDALPDLHAQLEAAAAAEPEPEPEQDQEDDIPLDLPLEPEELAQRQQRLFELQLESDQRMLTKKRRRRIRGYAHLPADAPGLAPRCVNTPIRTYRNLSSILSLSTDTIQRPVSMRAKPTYTSQTTCIRQ